MQANLPDNDSKSVEKSIANWPLESHRVVPLLQQRERVALGADTCVPVPTENEAKKANDTSQKISEKLG